MPTAEQRYKAANDYIERAIVAVESGSVWSYLHPLGGLAETLAGPYKTETARNELERIEARWLRATTDAERARIARDAELLADRAQENLPGAPQDRPRTNLYPGEVPKGTPATSYTGELVSQAQEVGRDAWGWFSHKADRAASVLGDVGQWLLIGGGVLLGIQAFGLLRDMERRRNLRWAPTRRMVNMRLAELAERTAPPGTQPKRPALRRHKKGTHKERKR